MGSKIEEVDNEYVITITFGERVENHTGNQMLGELGSEGMDLEDLKRAKTSFDKKGFKTELVDLVKTGGVEEIIPKPQPASVLIIRNGYKAFLGDIDLEEVNKEVLKDAWDKKCWMRGRVVNKKARWNLCYTDESQEPNYEKKEGRIIAFKEVPNLNKIREKLPKFFGEKANKLYAEGNYYYDKKNTYIGFHGDSERRIVIAMRLGNMSMPFHYQWFQKSEPIGNRIVIDLNPGDVYVMSEKAVGTDWKRKIIPTLRHATAKNEKWLVIKEKKVLEIIEEED